MGPLIYVMAIMGCGDGQAQCQQVRIADTHYVSADACVADSTAVLMKSTDLPYPEIVTECRRAPRDLVAQAQGKPRG